jgi:hypothetical protein
LDATIAVSAQPACVTATRLDTPSRNPIAASTAVTKGTGFWWGSRPNAAHSAASAANRTFQPVAPLSLTTGPKLRAKVATPSTATAMKSARRRVFSESGWADRG